MGMGGLTRTHTRRRHKGRSKHWTEHWSRTNPFRVCRLYKEAWQTRSNKLYQLMIDRIGGHCCKISQVEKQEIEKLRETWERKNKNKKDERKQRWEKGAVDKNTGGKDTVGILHESQRNGQTKIISKNQTKKANKRKAVQLTGGNFGEGRASLNSSHTYLLQIINNK